MKWISCMLPLFLVPLLVHVAQLDANDAAYIAKENRLANRDPGVCWWTCADMIGRHLKITTLVGLQERVLSEGGRAVTEGAHPDDIAAWLTKLKVKAQHITGKKDFAFIEESLKRGLPVLVTLKDWQTSSPKHTHAVVVWAMSKDKMEVTQGGVTTQDVRIDFIDPNNITWNTYGSKTWFADMWVGDAWTFDPRAQHQSVVSILRRLWGGRAPLSTLRRFRTTLDPSVRAATLLESGSQDGVNRPDDLFRFGCYAEGLGRVATRARGTK